MKSNVSFVSNNKREVKVVIVQNFNYRLFGNSFIQIIEKITDYNLSNCKGNKGK